MKMKVLIKRFWSKVEITKSCWNWIAFKDKDGYGQFGESSKIKHRSHRFSYELLESKIPKGLQLDHLCRNRGCVNPAHLQIVTSKENVRRSPSYNGSKTHCKRGHEFNYTNTYYHQSNTRKYRNCVLCRREIL